MGRAGPTRPPTRRRPEEAMVRWASGLWLLSGLAAGAGAIAATPLGLALALGPGAVGGLALWRRWPRLGAGAFAWTLGLAAWSAVQGWWWAALAGAGVGLVAWDISLAAVVSLDWEDGPCGYTPGGPWPARGWGWPPPGGP